MSRFTVRSRVLARACAERLASRRRPQAARRILVAHHLLAGDTFLLTPLLAKLRARHPAAEIVMTVRPALAPLYAGRPYGVRAAAFDPADGRTLDALLAERGFDLALVPGDNRHGWLAAALGARWIVAFAGDRPAPKSWMVDELRGCGATPAALGDLATELVDGPPPAPYRRGGGLSSVRRGDHGSSTDCSPTRSASNQMSDVPSRPSSSATKIRPPSSMACTSRL